MEELLIETWWKLRSAREFISWACTEFPGMTHMINNARQREIAAAEKLNEIKQTMGESACMVILGGIRYAQTCEWIREARG